MQSETEVQELTFQFQHLEISVQVRIRPRAGSTVSSTPSVEVAARTSPGVEPEEVAVVEQVPISRELEEQVLGASLAPDLAAVPLPFLRYLEDRLRGGDSQWTPRARLARAFRAGVAAHRRLIGEFCESSSPGIPYRNSIYIILRCPNHPHGIWTSDYSLFISNCGGNQYSDFDRNCVSHAYATRAEGDAFLQGARRRWPPALHR